MAPALAGGSAVDAQLASARAAIARGDGVAAEIELKKAQGSGAPRERIAASMGEALLIQKDLAGARSWLADGRFGPSETAYGFRLLGMVERFSGNAAAAQSAYDRALAAAPKDPLTWAEIGRLKFGQGDQLGAVDAANRALSFDPDNPRALELRAQMLREQAGWDAALPLYERALLRAPGDLDLLAGYAGTLGEAGRMRDMLTVTRRMIDIDAKDPRAWFFQATLAARAGKTELARRLLSRAGRGIESVPAAALLRGALELEAGNANAAVAILGQLVQRQPANETARNLLARALFEAGDLRGLIDRFSGLASRPDASPYLLSLVGRAWEEAGNRAAAAPYLDRAAAALAAPVMPVAYQPAGDVGGTVRAQILAGNFTAADASAQGYAAQRPGMFEALSLAGDAALAADAPDRALARYRQAMAVRFPERMLLRSVEALERSGMGREAPGLVSGYLHAFPSSMLAARLSAGHYAFAGDWAHSRSRLESLITAGSARDARLLADLALAQLETGDTDIALETAQRAAALSPNSGYAAMAWGLALAESGDDPDVARQLLTKARRIDGDNPRLAEALQRLGK